MAPAPLRQLTTGYAACEEGGKRGRHIGSLRRRLSTRGPRMASSTSRWWDAAIGLSKPSGGLIYRL
jgi:hypothetical protein